MRLCVFALATMLLAAPCLRGWSNGETVSIYHDLRSGMIFPMQKTPIEVRHQKLTMYLDPPHATIETTYTLYNPLNEPKTVHIAFAIPGDVRMHQQPVWLDGKPVRWRYQLSDEVLREVQPVLQQAIERGLQRRPELRRVLQEALRQTPKGAPLSREQFDKIAQRHAPNLEYSQRESLYAYYRIRAGFPPTRFIHRFSEFQDDPAPRELAQLALALGEQQSLPHVRWNAEPRYLNIRTGALLTARELARYERESLDELYPLSLLRFDITLQPHRQHQLRVRYEQLMGHIELSGVSNGPVPLDGGYHLMYLLRTQSWAKYGAIDVEISIPQELRLRAAPVARYTEQRNGRRIYRARLIQPKGNLHVTVAERDEIYHHPVVVRTHDWRGQPSLAATSLRARMLDGEPYISFSDLAPKEYRPSVQAKGTTLTIGERVFQLRYPARMIEGALYVHLRDAFDHDFAFYLPRSKYESAPIAQAREVRKDHGVGSDARIRYDAWRGLVILEDANRYAGGAR